MITSLQNNYIKQVASLKSAKGRKKTGLFIVEGIKAIREIDTSWQLDSLIYTENCDGMVKEELQDFHSKSKRILVGDKVFEYLTDTVTPQGILAVVHQKEWDVKDTLNNQSPFLILLDQLQDPGNLGTIIRTADAAGADGVILSSNSVDVYNPKIVRATMGSLFHLPVISKVDIKKTIETLQQYEIGVYAAHLKGASYPYEVDFKKGTAILIGNEGKGLDNEIADLSNQYIKLPMPGSAESLNAAVAASILTYEVVRQRLK
ncbi:TrmH family RNA methyltransferase [Vallitalea okinawensis]|uniref:TrmH family RNA methyltransferase n=1 Tax=Vallitalea okinawensis TaxID=2078660 RepID=UPI000CFB1885|nr:RNA methyltransferase [Vallitalea okinawensis]